MKEQPDQGMCYALGNSFINDTLYLKGKGKGFP